MGVSSTAQVGDSFDLNNGSSAVIVEYVTHDEINVVTRTGYKTTVKMGSLKRGQVADKFWPTVLGIGYVGVGNYGRANNYGAYKVWAEMLNEHKHSAIKMCDDWLNFQIFAEWFYRSNWKYGWKFNALLIDPKANVHSEQTTIFIPRWLDSMLYGRGHNPSGISLSYGKWRSSLKVNKQLIHHCVNNSKKEAIESYREAKKAYILEAMESGELPGIIHGGLGKFVEDSI